MGHPNVHAWYVRMRQRQVLAQATCGRVSHSVARACFLPPVHGARLLHSRRGPGQRSAWSRTGPYRARLRRVEADGFCIRSADDAGHLCDPAALRDAGRGQEHDLRPRHRQAGKSGEEIGCERLLNT
eukprot:6178627-Pleurochrysis_carterae.AAC.4